jgi:hypothetical protein
MASREQGPGAAMRDQATCDWQTVRSTRRGMRQWRPSTKVSEHKEERSLERLVDMEVSRKKDSIWDFWGSLAEARRTSEQKYSTRAIIAVSIKFFGRIFGRPAPPRVKP